MKIRSYYAFIIMLVLAAQFTATAFAQQVSSPDFVASSYWGYGSSVITAYPGAYNLPLTVEVKYLGPVTLYNVNIAMLPSFPIKPAIGQGNLTLSVPELEPGATLTLSGLFNVSNKASIMVYNESLRIGYEVITQENTAISGIKYVNFSLPVVGFYNIKLSGFSTFPTIIYSGERAGELKVYLVNSGNAQANSLNVTVLFKNPLSPLYTGSNKEYIAYLPPGQPANLTFPFYISNSKPFNTTATVNVNAPAGNWTFSVPIESFPDANFTAISETYGTVTPGSSDVNLNIELQNTGHVESKFTTVTLLFNPVFTPYAPSSENPLIAAESINNTVGNVAPSQYVNVTYVISVSSGVRPGTYYVPLLVSWYQEPTMQPIHQIVEVPVKITPSFSLLDGYSTIYIIAIIVIIVLLSMVVIGRRRK